MTVEGITDRKEGEVPVIWGLVTNQEEEELVENEANIMVYTDVKNEGA